MAAIDERALLPGQRPSSAVPDPALHLNVRPSAFGGQVAEGLQQFGSSALQAGQHWGQIVADDMATQFETGARKILYGDPDKPIQNPDGTTSPDTGYFGTQGRTALDGRKSTEQKLDDLMKETRGKLSSFDQQKAFDSVTRRYRNILSGKIGEHADRQAKVYATSVNTATIKEKVEGIASNPNDEDSFLHNTADMIDAATKNAQLHGAQPGDAMWNAAQNGAKAAAAEARIRAIGANDPVRAMRMADHYRDVLGTHYDNLVDHYRARSEQQEGRAVADEVLTGSRPNENNIGNVRPRGASTGFVQSASFDEGVKLAVNNARAYPAAFNGGKDMTLQQIGAKWAPKGDGANDPNQWAKNVAAGSGLPVDRPIDLNDPETAAKFARGVHVAEWGGQKARPVEEYKKALSAPASVQEAQPRTQADLIAEVQSRNLPPQAEAAAIARINQSYSLRQAGETRRRADFKQKVDDSTAEALHTGVTSNPLSESDFVSHYGPEDGAARYADYQSNLVYSADRKSLETMSDTEQSQFLAARTPQPGARGYAHAMNRQAQLEKDAAAIQKARREDPAGSVDKNPAVQAAMGRYDPNDPASFKSVADARIEAQAALGIEPEFRSPITKAEALKLTTPLRTMLPGDEPTVLRDLGVKFQKMFGDQADEAFAYAIRAHRVDAEVAQQAAAVVRKLRDGLPLLPSDAAGVDAAKEQAAAANAVRGFPRATAPGRAPLRVIENADNAAPVEGSPVVAPRNVPPGAIEYLLRNPGSDAAFDQKYGAGRAKEIREKYPVSPGLP